MTEPKPDPKIRKLALYFLKYYAPSNISDAEYTTWVDSLALEFDAAIADRWIEWKDARKDGWPLDRPLVERGGEVQG